MMDLRTRRVLAVEGGDMARRWVIPPGSTVKPLSLAALLESGKMRAGERYSCSRRVRIGGRSFDCSHPPAGGPMQIGTAIAYSCNCFVAHFARRFERGELARLLARERLSSRSGLLGPPEAAGELQPALDPEASELQAIGEEHVTTTPLGLLAAYANLAARAPGPVLEGLEGAVEYGTAQLATVPGVKVAGKTGTVLTSTGAKAAWFAGFAPSRKPEVAIVAVVQGRSGGLDAAPIAARMLAERF